MREIIFLSIVGTTGLALQTTLIGFIIPGDYKPDLILSVVIWAGLRATYIAGLVFSFVIGLCVDALSGSPTGFFGLIYCLAFVASGYVHSVVPIDDPIGWVVTVFLASMILGCLVLMMRWLGGSEGLSVHTAMWITLKSIVTGGAAAALFPCLDKARTGYSRIIGEH